MCFVLSSNSIKYMICGCYIQVMPCFRACFGFWFCDFTRWYSERRKYWNMTGPRDPVCGSRCKMCHGLCLMGDITSVTSLAANLMNYGMWASPRVQNAEIWSLEVKHDVVFCSSAVNGDVKKKSRRLICRLMNWRIRGLNLCISEIYFRMACTVC